MDVPAAVGVAVGGGVSAAAGQGTSEGQLINDTLAEGFSFGHLDRIQFNSVAVGNTMAQQGVQERPV